MDLVRSTFSDIEKVLAHIVESHGDVLAGYKTFVAKFDEYWNTPLI